MAQVTATAPITNRKSVATHGLASGLIALTATIIHAFFHFEDFQDDPDWL